MVDQLRPPVACEPPSASAARSPLSALGSNKRLGAAAAGAVLLAGAVGMLLVRSSRADAAAKTEARRVAAVERCEKLAVTALSLVESGLSSGQPAVAAEPYAGVPGAYEAIRAGVTEYNAVRAGGLAEARSATTSGEALDSLMAGDDAASASAVRVIEATCAQVQGEK